MRAVLLTVAAIVAASAAGCGHATTAAAPSAPARCVARWDSELGVGVLPHGCPDPGHTTPHAD